MRSMRFLPVLVAVCLGCVVSCAMGDAGRETGGTKGSGGADSTAGTGGTSTSTGAGGATTSGTGGAGTGGSTTTGTGGTGTGGATTTTGTGGAAGTTTGTGGAAGTTTGTGGTAGTTTGTGGKAGSAGTGGTGTAGTGGGGTIDAGSKGDAAGSGGTGTDAGGPLIDVAKVLHGAMMLATCLMDTEAAVCATKTGACPPANTSDGALSGVLMTDKTVTLGGTMGTPYTITLHVQGEVESKSYGGKDQNSTAASPKADGFCVGGTPTTADFYNVYMVRVTNPGGAKTDYFLNSLGPPGTSNHTTYGIDYTAKIQAQGGATIRLVAADANCSTIKNCGPQVSGTTCLAPITMTGIEPDAISLNSTFDFTKAYNGQWVVMTVKDVTTP